MTTDLIELAFFPPQNGSRDWASSKAHERLRELWLWGYLEPIELPVAHVLGGRRPFLYALGRQGVASVEQRMGTAALPVQPRRLDRLDHVFIDHDLKAAALWANLHAGLRGRRGCRLVWVGEHELRAKRLHVRVQDVEERVLGAFPARRVLRGHLPERPRAGGAGRDRHGYPDPAPLRAEGAGVRARAVRRLAKPSASNS